MYASGGDFTKNIDAFAGEGAISICQQGNRILLQVSFIMSELLIKNT